MSQHRTISAISQRIARSLCVGANELGHVALDDDGSIKQGKVAHEAENSLDLSAFDVRDAHQLRRAPEIGRRTRRSDDSDGFTARTTQPA